jgi:hypothetical protein
MANFSIASQVPDSNDRSATKIVRYLLYTGPASYVTFGDLVNPGDVGLTAIDFINPVGNLYNKAGTSMYLLSWDYTSGTLVAYVPSTGVEVASGVNLSAYSVLCECVGH